jgi:cell division protein FtsZ
MMGTGEGEGERRAVDAAEAAISNPLLDDVSLRGGAVSSSTSPAAST